MRRVCELLLLVVLLIVLVVAALSVLDIAMRIRKAQCFSGGTSETTYYGCSFRLIK